MIPRGRLLDLQGALGFPNIGKERISRLETSPPAWCVFCSQSRVLLCLQQGLPPPVYFTLSSAIVSTAGLKPVFCHLLRGLMLRPSHCFTSPHGEYRLYSLGVCFWKFTISVHPGDSERFIIIIRGGVTLHLSFPKHSWSSWRVCPHPPQLPDEGYWKRQYLPGHEGPVPPPSGVSGACEPETCSLRSSEKTPRGPSPRSSLCLPGQSNCLWFSYYNIKETTNYNFAMKLTITLLWK